MWNERFAGDDYVYGTEANDFLRAQASQIPHGAVLSLGEGEGRNAIHLAQLGYRVHAIDGAEQGRRKALRLAAERGLTLDYTVEDLARADLGQSCWQGIVNIFCHLPAELHAQVLRQCVQALAPGGVLLMELYHPRQLEFATGGPRDRGMLVSLDDLRLPLAELHWLHAAELEREVVEGILHTGRAAVTQLVARKPA